MSNCVNGKIVLVLRGGATFALKSHWAAKAGALAVISVDHVPSEASKDLEDDARKGFEFPAPVIPIGPLFSQINVAYRAGSCALPPIPLYLINHRQGQQIIQSLQSDISEKVKVEFTVESHPLMNVPQTLGSTLCKCCVLYGSGIGILYGLVRCAGVEVGGEFIEASDYARRMNKPIVLVDVSIETLGSALKKSLIPYPQHIFLALRWWLAVPRWVVRYFFPSRNSMDLVGVMIWSLMRFKVRTWLAFAIAGFCASYVLTALIMVPGKAVSAGMKSGGMDEESASMVEALMPLFIQLYVVPRVWEALVNHRDEAMFQSIVHEVNNKVRGASSLKNFVVVIGAAHANGIIRRMRSISGYQ